MPDSATVVVRCSGCGIRLLVKASAVISRRSLCPQCASIAPNIVTHRFPRQADDDQIVAWLLEGDPNAEDV